MKYKAVWDARIYKMEDELYARHPEFDYVIVVPSLKKYLAVGTFEAKVWQLIERDLSDGEIVGAMSVETKEFEADRIRRLILDWQREKIVFPKNHPNAPEAKNWWQKLVWTEFTSKQLAPTIERIYFNIGKYFFTRGGALILSTLFMLGAASLWSNIITGTLEAAFSQPPPFFLVLLFAFISLSLHELGHGLAMVWAEAPISRVGVALYLGLPVFFVDTTTVWSKRRKKRIITASAGMVVNVAIAAIASITMRYFPAIAPGLLAEIIFINLFTVALSLIPFIKMDGYYILLDLIGIPNLNDAALQKIREVGQHPKQFKLTTGNILLASYAVISGIFSGLLILYSVWYWLRLIRIFLA